MNNNTASALAEMIGERLKSRSGAQNRAERRERQGTTGKPDGDHDCPGPDRAVGPLPAATGDLPATVGQITGQAASACFRATS